MSSGVELLFGVLMPANNTFRYLFRFRKQGQRIDVFKEKRAELGLTLFITFLLLVLASSVMYYMENEAQPDKFPNILSSFWWAIATLTTVGYGDVFPITAAGKVISSIIALLGIGVVALPTGILSAAFMNKIEESKKSKEEQEEIICPHCNKKINN